MGAHTMTSRLTTAWERLPPRERWMVVAMATVVGCLLGWMLAVRPAWLTLRHAPDQLAQAEQSLQRMQQLAAEAAALQQLGPVTPLSREQRQSQLQGVVAQAFGASARLQVQGSLATVIFDNLSADRLAQATALLRQQLALKPQASRLERQAESSDLWRGSITWALDDEPPP